MPSSFCLQYQNHCRSCRKGAKPPGASTVSGTKPLLHCKYFCCQLDIGIRVCGQVLPTAQDHTALCTLNTCSLVQRNGAALMHLVTFPAHVAATAVWHCWKLLKSPVWITLVSSQQKKKKGISRVKEKILRTMENSPHLPPAKHRKQQWQSDQLFHSHHTIFLQAF